MLPPEYRTELHDQFRYLQAEHKQGKLTAGEVARMYFDYLHLLKKQVSSARRKTRAHAV